MMLPCFGCAPKSELGRGGLGAREFLGKVCPFPNTLPLCVQQRLTSNVQALTFVKVGLIGLPLDVCDLCSHHGLIGLCD